MSTGKLPAEDIVLAGPVEAMTSVQPKPWGVWATVFFSLAVIVVFIAIQTAVVIAFMALQAPRMHNVGSRDCEGLLLSLATWIAGPLCIAVLIMVVKLRKQLPIRDYLSLNRVSLSRFLVWAAVLVGFVTVTDGVTWLLGRDVVPAFMFDIYRTAVIVPLLLATLFIVAPVFEEMLFRGFMFQGIQQSRLGNLGAVLITSFTWSMIHLQYDAYQIAVVFGGGILLGAARARSNSIFLTIALHSLMNLIAVVELWTCL